MRRHSVELAVERGRQRAHFHAMFLPQFVQGPGAVFPAAPREDNALHCDKVCLLGEVRLESGGDQENRGATIEIGLSLSEVVAMIGQSGDDSRARTGRWALPGGK